MDLSRGLGASIPTSKMKIKPTYSLLVDLFHAVIDLYGVCISTVDHYFQSPTTVTQQLHPLLRRAITSDTLLHHFSEEKSFPSNHPNKNTATK